MRIEQQSNGSYVRKLTYIEEQIINRIKQEIKDRVDEIKRIEEKKYEWNSNEEKLDDIVVSINEDLNTVLATIGLMSTEINTDSISCGNITTDIVNTKSIKFNSLDIKSIEVSVVANSDSQSYVKVNNELIKITISGLLKNSGPGWNLILINRSNGEVIFKENYINLYQFKDKLNTIGNNTVLIAWTYKDGMFIGNDELKDALYSCGASAKINDITNTSQYILIGYGKCGKENGKEKLVQNISTSISTILIGNNLVD